MKHSFGSDNHSGVAEEILQAIIEENKDYAIAYGEDELSKEVLLSTNKLFGGDTYPYFAINGTGANILCLRAMMSSYHSIICAKTAHINVDESGAPELFTGAKIIAIDHIDGKIYPQEIKKHLNFGSMHHSQPKVISISQPTELGTLYTIQEIKDIADLAHNNNCYLHIDGSRISNACAALKCSLKEITKDSGADALSLGGTKNGLLQGEIIVFFRKEFSLCFDNIRKQSAQVYSKSRFMAAQFKAYFKDNLYLQLANKSNSAAKYLEEKLSALAFVQITRPVETNAVFAIIPKEYYQPLRDKHYFYIWDESTMELRWMCSFATKKEDIDRFVQDLIDIHKNK